jgi:type III secretory pathway component EscS
LPAYDRTLWLIFLNSSPFLVIQNVIGAPSQALQTIFKMQRQRTSPKRAVKKTRFLEL